MPSGRRSPQSGGRFLSELAATITATSALVAAVGVILGAFWAYRAKREAAAAARAADIAAKEVIRIGDQVFEVGKAVDGRLTDLLEAMAAKGIVEVAKAHLEGVAEGEQKQRDRQSSPETSADGGRRLADNGGKGG